MSQFKIIDLQFLDHVLFATQIQGGRQLIRVTTRMSVAYDTKLTTGLRISGNPASGYEIDIVGSASAAAAGAAAASVGDSKVSVVAYANADK